MVDDLHMRGSDYNLALFVFFIPVRCKPLHSILPNPMKDTKGRKGLEFAGRDARCVNFADICFSIFCLKYRQTLFSSGSHRPHGSALSWRFGVSTSPGSSSGRENH
jgi:hypothetical protein